MQRKRARWSFSTRSSQASPLAQRPISSMNLLAHLWLADRSHTSAAGQILGDIVKGRVSEGHFQPAVTRGIRLHRLIDSSCDAHKVHRDLRRSFSPPMRRFAGIIVDIGFDYAL